MKKAQGILPTMAWLLHNKYSGLVSAINLHPKAFAHIEQRYNGGRTPKEWVAIAKRLAKEHGKLPTRRWLEDHGYYGLYQAKRLQPQLFSKIAQAKDTHTPSEWLIIARQLAKQHGRIPHATWLIKHGYSGLYNAMQVHPKVFACLRRDRKRTWLNEWITIAERLARTHNGLPSGMWLLRHGYSGLRAAIQHNREQFAHLKQKWGGGRSIPEWVKVAEKLAKTHKGTLPCQYWLAQNGYAALASAISKNRKAFAHITQERRRRSLKETVQLAEALAHKYGELPSYSWLKKNGYGPLVTSKGFHPEAFAHISQKRLRP